MDLKRDHHMRIEVSTLREVLAQLPPLPPQIRYYDEFDDALRSIRCPADSSRFAVHANGSVISIDFERVSELFAILLKHTFLGLMGEDLAPRTAAQYTIGAKHFGQGDVVSLLDAGPARISTVWASFFARGLPADAYSCAKAMLRLLCRHCINGWSESYFNVISALPLPFKDKYAVVRSGEAFLSVEDEAAIVGFLDHFAARCNGAAFEEEDALQDAAMLLCAYQFGMRPIQVAMLAWKDIRIWRTSADSPPTVHLTFRMVKQRASSASKPLLRRVKNEWSPLFLALSAFSKKRGFDPSDRAFGVQSSTEASRRIARLLRDLTGRDGSAYTLRHTAAQRLVDAGASQEELAEFLGHSDITTGLVYYETSANQAELVNNALGISEIYKRVARIAHSRFISQDELAQLKETQQLGGVPHGLSIAGIGGCTSGQPACPYNPILSCYGCRKFMPIHDLSVHTKVLSDFRSVARHFHDASRGDSVSPTYLQLKRTISEVQAVVDELGSSTS